MLAREGKVRICLMQQAGNAADRAPNHQAGIAA